MKRLTIKTARRFLLLKQGLIGKRRFAGKRGVLEYVRQAGCIQFDPVNVCGRNAELTLLARVSRFSKNMLDELLYRDRLLFDYTDKELSILPVEDYPYFERYRRRCREHARKFPAMRELEEFALEFIRLHGATDAKSLPLSGETEWHSAIHWSGSWSGRANAARSALEQLYTAGELMIHHKDGTRKSYELAARLLPAELLAAPDPLEDELSHLKWRILRRVGAVGLLWDRRSDALLGLSEFGNEARSRAFSELLSEGRLLELGVDGVSAPLFMKSEDAPLLARAEGGEGGGRLAPRCEFLAPLDPFLWDRRLIRALFDFSYAWEIYTPPAKRKYGAYTLPVLRGESFIGRIEAAAERETGTLQIKNLWLEQGVSMTRTLEAAVRGAAERLMRFNGLSSLEL